MLNAYRRVLELLDARERTRFHLVMMMILFMAVIDAVGIASILPFLAMVTNRAIIRNNDYISAFYDYFQFQNEKDFLVFVGFTVFGFYVFSLSFKALTIYVMTRFYQMRNFSLSTRLLRGYLHQPYVWFLRQHSADLSRKILAEVDQFISAALSPLMTMIAQGVVTIVIAIMLILVQPSAAFTGAAVIGGSYLFLYLGVRRYLSKIGQRRFQANKQRYQVVAEAIGGFKEVKFLGVEEVYLRRYRAPAQRFSAAKATTQAFAQIPRIILEMLAFGGMMLFVVLVLVEDEQRLETVVPLVGLYAVAGVRLFPAVQALFAGFSAMRVSNVVIENLRKDLRRNEAALVEAPPPANGAKLALAESLELDGVGYTYPEGDRPALDQFTLRIDARTTVGIVGGTGAGKTTAVDVLLGLLAPQQGVLRVDGQAVTRENVRAWQRSIGYVPQTIFLVDDTIAANIAFGVKAADIDMAAVERAARVAALHDFVLDQLPQGYQTLVGERGVRLSGGQRQRIGIARALYADPDLLVFDEATSALDNITERSVIDAVKAIGRTKTVVMIAHRLSTVRDCDVIHLLRHGRLVASGSYQVLLETSPEFRALERGDQAEG
jgi:ABC-type multidrug transport system fused ATPase/permease subunit